MSSSALDHDAIEGGAHVFFRRLEAHGSARGPPLSHLVLCGRSPLCISCLAHKGFQWVLAATRELHSLLCAIFLDR